MPLAKRILLRHIPPPIVAACLMLACAYDSHYHCLQVREAKLEACWSLMIGFDQRIDVPFDGAFVNTVGAAVSWVLREGAKPARTSTLDCWTGALSLLTFVCFLSCFDVSWVPREGMKPARTSA